MFLCSKDNCLESDDHLESIRILFVCMIAGWMFLCSKDNCLESDDHLESIRILFVCMIGL